MNWLNYHHLLYFKVIATEGGIAPAAKKLRLGQPTLSTQLKQLEENFGQKLFERRNRKLVLTEAGKIALEYAREIFQLGEEMVDALQDRPESGRIRLQIGALDGVPKHVTLALIQRAFASSNCSISVAEGHGDELLKELRSHKLDLILSNFPPPPSVEGQSIFSRPVAELPVFVYGAPKFKALTKGFPHSLSGQPIILPTRHSKLRHDLDHYFQSQRILVDAVAEIQDTSVQRLLGASAAGVVPLSSEAASELVKERKLVRIGSLQGVAERIWLISASRRIENPVAARLMKDFELS